MFNNLLSIFKSKKNSESVNFFKEGVIEVACIFIRVGKLDNHLATIEKEKIKALLIKRFDLDRDILNSILTKAEEIEVSINDNVQLTKKIKQHINFEERFDLLKDIWEIILADEIKTDEEESYMRLLCNLLGLSDKDNALARKDVLKAHEKK